MQHIPLPVLLVAPYSTTTAITLPDAEAVPTVTFSAWKAFSSLSQRSCALDFLEGVDRAAGQFMLDGVGTFERLKAPYFHHLSSAYETTNAGCDGCGSLGKASAMKHGTR